jgi:hypothetical protein
MSDARLLAFVLAERARLELDIEAIRLDLCQTPMFSDRVAFDCLRRTRSDAVVGCSEFARYLVSRGQLVRPIDVFRLFRRYVSRGEGRRRASELTA